MFFVNHTIRRASTGVHNTFFTQYQWLNKTDNSNKLIKLTYIWMNEIQGQKYMNNILFQVKKYFNINNGFYSSVFF